MTMHHHHARSARTTGASLRSAALVGGSVAVAIVVSLVAAQSIAADQQTHAKRTGGAPAASTARPLEPASQRLNDEALVAHVLNRLAYGPRSGDVDRVRRIGVDAYID